MHMSPTMAYGPCEQAQGSFGTALLLPKQFWFSSYRKVAFFFARACPVGKTFGRMTSPDFSNGQKMPNTLNTLVFLLLYFYYFFLVLFSACIPDSLCQWAETQPRNHTNPDNIQQKINPPQSYPSSTETNPPPRILYQSIVYCTPKFQPTKKP